MIHNRSNMDNKYEKNITVEQVKINEKDTKTEQVKINEKDTKTEQEKSNKAYLVSLKGNRESNEDRHTIILNMDGNNKLLNKINMFGVYDGHGGRPVSKFLSEYLPDLLTDKRIKYPILKPYIEKVYSYLNDVLKKNYEQQTLQCGSTCLVGLNYKYNNASYLTICNTGDSRCVLCRDNFAIPLTKDHKPDWPEETRRIIGLGGEELMKRDNYGDMRIKDLSVSRAFGDYDTFPFVTYEPDVFRYKLDDKKDKFCVFACDGLWDVVSNQDVVNFIIRECYETDLHTRKHENINIARKLGEYALTMGSEDNITIVIYFF